MSSKNCAGGNIFTWYLAQLKYQIMDIIWAQQPTVLLPTQTLECPTWFCVSISCLPLITSWAIFQHAWQT